MIELLRPYECGHSLSFILVEEDEGGEVVQYIFSGLK
ncbi:hypothetical protein Calab_1900 [Caldithrix abyssi DSM 13497]|nr:hypothetical protein Calab_1900 [Caldithrix abyssi DSM 13497]